MTNGFLVCSTTISCFFFVHSQIRPLSSVVPLIPTIDRFDKNSRFLSLLFVSKMKCYVTDPILICLKTDCGRITLQLWNIIFNAASDMFPAVPTPRDACLCANSRLLHIAKFGEHERWLIGNNMIFLTLVTNKPAPLWGDYSSFSNL